MRTEVNEDDDEDDDEDGANVHLEVIIHICVYVSYVIYYPSPCLFIIYYLLSASMYHVTVEQEILASTIFVF